MYIASGKAHFFFDGREEIVPAGYMVLYQPRQEQHYEYYGEEKPEVYWVHFTGKDVKLILRHFDIPMDKNVFFSGVPSAYQRLFKEYLLSLRMNNAVSLLETTDYNVTEISAIVGYENPLYFSRLFKKHKKKHKGVSPSEYRKLLQKKNSPNRDTQGTF